MSEAIQKTQVVTLRVPVELKSRLDQQAKTQGVSLNNLAKHNGSQRASSLWKFSNINATPQLPSFLNTLSGRDAFR